MKICKKKEKKQYKYDKKNKNKKVQNVTKMSATKNAQKF